MQIKSLLSISLAIERVSNDGMAHGAQMKSELVRSSGQGNELQVRALAAAPDKLPVRNRLLAIRPVDAAFWAILPAPADGQIDPA